MGEFLGLGWRRVPADRYDTRITMNGYAGEIRMPDKFLSIPKDKWLRPESLPAQPLKTWESEELGLPVNLIDKRLPVIYGAPDFMSPEQPGNLNPEPSILYLPIDIFGSAFFMLTRYEEIIKPDRDEHARFPAWASLAYQENFLARPIIDEYVEVLWAGLHHLWPRLQRGKRQFQIKVSHDVDRPTRYGYQSLFGLLRSMGGDILKRGDVKHALQAPLIRIKSKYQLHPADPYNTFDWIMDQSDARGLVSAFYFICGHTHPTLDGLYEVTDKPIRQLMSHIHKRGHEIGLHPSYNTYNAPELIKQEADRLRCVFAEEGIKQYELGGRVHYLRWQQPSTLCGFNDAGLDYDNTLCYADRVGFRCGTCIEYSAFDPINKSSLPLHIRPLIVMEGTIMSRHYMNLRKQHDIIDNFLVLKNACIKVQGCFAFLWHNSELFSKELREIYTSVL